jgi:hypothetical protein
MAIQTVEAVLMPDGSIHLSTPLQVHEPRRVIVILLDEPARQGASQEGIPTALHDDSTQFRA